MKEERPRQRAPDNSVILEEMRKRKKDLLDSIGNEVYNGVDLFEGTKPAAPEMTEMQASSPLGSVASGDPGVDISSIVALGGKKWKALMG